MAIIQQQTERKYRCPRCGAESTLPRDVDNRYCALCGIFGAELDGHLMPAAPQDDAEVYGCHRLPAAC